MTCQFTFVGTKLKFQETQISYNMLFKCGFFKIDIVHKLKSWFAICYMSLREKFETGNIFYLIFQCWFKSSNLIVDRENDLTVNQ